MSALMQSLTSTDEAWRTNRVGLSADTGLFALFCAYLCTFVLEGPIRFALYSVGQPNLLYLRDLVAGGSIAIIFLRSLLSQSRLEPAITTLVAVLIVHAGIGVAYDVPIFQILIGIKIFVSMVYGAAMWPIIRMRLRPFVWLLCGFFAVTSIGVFVNAAVGQFPWEGQAYETAFGTVQTTKEWWAAGTRRLPGFARASFDAALMTGLTACLLLAASPSALVRLAISQIALGAIFLTTTKGMLAPVLIAAVWLLWRGGRHQVAIGIGITRVLFLVTTLLPTLVVLYGLGGSSGVKDVPFYLSSLWERFEEMWPRAVSLLTPPFGYLLGAGLGSIGTPQALAGADFNVNAADSIFVYYFVNFGMISVLYLAFPLIPARRIWRTQSRSTTLAYLSSLVIAYGYGITTNMIEQPFFCSFFGLVHGLAFQQLLDRHEADANDTAT